MDESIIKDLKEVNLYKENNYIFAASERPVSNKYSLYVPLFSNSDEDDIYTFVINYTNEGIGILPLCDGVEKDKAIFINKDSITKVDIVKKWTYYLINIIINNQKVFSFRANKKDIYLKSHKESIKKFISDYNS